MTQISALVEKNMIPDIDPIPPGPDRPLWSVMIPTFNPNPNYLRQTLNSVLAQDPGPDQMQIQVVDNCSNVNDPEPIVRGTAGSRAKITRNATNFGAIANFNRCIEQSRGHLVHILHADDYIHSEFYRRSLESLEKGPSLSAVFSRSIIIDGRDQRLWVTPDCPALRRSPNNPRDFFRRNPLRCPGVVVRRSFYERFGGFDTDLVHVADWEMWVRAIVFGGARMLQEPLAYYREHDQNETSRMVRTAEELRDYFRLSAKWRTAGPEEFDQLAFDRESARIAFRRAVRFLWRGDHEAAVANYRLWQEHATLSQYPLAFADEFLTLGRAVARRAIRPFRRSRLPLA